MTETPDRTGLLPHDATEKTEDRRSQPEGHRFKNPSPATIAKTLPGGGLRGPEASSFDPDRRRRGCSPVIVGGALQLLARRGWRR